MLYAAAHARRDEAYTIYATFMLISERPRVPIRLPLRSPPITDYYRHYADFSCRQLIDA